MSKINGWYGWRPDKPDARDKKFQLRETGALADSIDLRESMPNVYDQGNLGSCTANCIAGALEFDMLKQGEARAATPSRLFIYYNERVMEGNVSEDAGAEIRDGIKSVNQLGAPPEIAWPYVISKFARKPPAKAYRKAMSRQSLTYQRIDNTKIDDMRGCLAEGFPFVFGFTVYESFEQKPFETTWVLPMPKKTEQVLGGHAVLAVGYDDAKQLFLVRNSWGSDWGIKGYYWQPYAYLSNTNLADDFWVINTVE